jgi:hypothetical protein
MKAQMTMRVVSRILIATGVSAGLSGCGSDKLVACAEDIETITATVVNQVGQPLAGLEVTATVRRTGTVLTLTQSPVQELPSAGGSVMVFSDEFQRNIRPGGEDVSVVVTAGGHSGSGLFRFGSNGCHVQKLSGPDSLTVS